MAGAVAAVAVGVIEVPTGAARADTGSEVAKSAPTKVSASRDPQGDLTAPDAVSASINARLAGERVENLAARTEDTSTFAMPDGTWQTSTATGPVWVRKGGDGTQLADWAGVDATLGKNADGSFSPVAQAGDIKIAGATKASDGTSVVASFTDPDTKVASQLTYPGDLPAPTVDGPRATYADVQPGVDMVVDVTGTGVEQYFVVKDKPTDPAALVLSTTVAATGKTAQGLGVKAKETDPAKGGDVASLVTKAGDPVAAVGLPQVWDSRYDDTLANPVAKSFDTAAQPGVWTGTAQGQAQTEAAAKVKASDPAPTPAEAAAAAEAVSPLSVGVEATGASAQVDLTPGDDTSPDDPAEATSVADVLADPDTVFPVVVDPSVSLHVTTDTWVQSNSTDSKAGSTQLRVGTYDDGTDVARSFLQFSSSSFKGTQISSAKLTLWEYYSWSCSARGYKVGDTTTNSSTSTVWSNQPAWHTTYTTVTDAKGYSSSCAAGNSVATVTSMAQDWADSSSTTHTASLRASDESDSYGWKYFNSANADTGKPTLTVSYNSYPATAKSGSISPYVWYPANDTTGQLEVKSLTPTVKAVVSDPDGGNVKAQFYLTDSSDSNKVIWNWVSGSTVASGGTSSYTPTTNLPAGHTFVLQIRANDGSLSSKTVYKPWNSAGKFTLNTGAPAAPTVTATGLTANQTADPAPSSSTFTAVGSNTDVYELEYKTETDTSWNEVPVSSSTLWTTTPTATWTWAPLPTGKHTVQVRTVDKAGNVSTTPTSFTFTAAGAALTAPAPDQRSTDVFNLAANGPTASSGSVAATAYYRIAGGPAGAGDATVNGSTAGWTAITGSGATFAAGQAVSYSSRFSTSALSQVQANLRGTVQLQVQVCFAYSSPSLTRCSWSSGAAPSGKPTITRVPSAFGDDFPVADAGPGQVALWTGSTSSPRRTRTCPGTTGTCRSPAPTPPTQPRRPTPCSGLGGRRRSTVTTPVWPGGTCMTAPDRRATAPSPCSTTTGTHSSSAPREPLMPPTPPAPTPQLTRTPRHREPHSCSRPPPR
nr:DNRLRE domain-containing protein [Luteimicrobium album]